MGPSKDLTKEKFGRLQPVKVVDKRGSQYVWRCKCDCGKFHNVMVGNLRSGNTKSCGCLARERLLKARKQRQSA